MDGSGGCPSSWTHLVDWSPVRGPHGPWRGAGVALACRLLSLASRWFPWSGVAFGYTTEAVAHVIWPRPTRVAAVPYQAQTARASVLVLGRSLRDKAEGFAVNRHGKGVYLMGLVCPSQPCRAYDPHEL